jgi:hypothetical protein
MQYFPRGHRLFLQRSGSRRESPGYLDPMEHSLPLETWKEIILNVLVSSGRNDALRSRLLCRRFLQFFDTDTQIWKEIVLNYFLRTFHGANPQILRAMSGPQWKRLAFALFSLGYVNNIVESPNIQSPFYWMFPDDGRGSDSDPEDSSSITEDPTYLEDINFLKQSMEQNIDRYLVCNGRPIYNFGQQYESMAFWFRYHKSLDGSRLSIRLSEILRQDFSPAVSSSSTELPPRILDNTELLSSLASLFPKDKWRDDERSVQATHCVIRPVFVSSDPTDPNSYHNDEHSRVRGYEYGLTMSPEIGYYKYFAPTLPLPFVDYGSVEYVHILIPMQDPERVGFDEDRIKYYEDLFRSGAMPTIAALTFIHRKYRHGSGPLATSTTQFVFASLVLDGHHKLEAARRLNWPVGLLMITKEYGHEEILERINCPVPTTPLSQLERSVHFPADDQGPHLLLFDNWPCYTAPADVESEKSAIAAAMPEPALVKRVLLANQFQEVISMWTHGGYIEFTTQAAKMRALEEAQGRSVLGSRLALQLPTTVASELHDYVYDSAHQDGVRRFYPPSAPDVDGGRGRGRGSGRGRGRGRGRGM